jgi:hypothetical protein
VVDVNNEVILVPPTSIVTRPAASTIITMMVNVMYLLPQNSRS